ncbi:MAG: amidohydrolase family protein [Bacillota bacterium]|nr:amidohydrolase family protein [Bacillota bacterium]
MLINTIDCHTHCFPPRIALAALEQLRQNSGGLKPWTDGTADGLISQMDQCGIQASWVLNIATTPGQQQAVNNFAAAGNSARIISFGSVHPDAPDALDELERMASLGIRGLKLHPFFQHFAADDPKMKPIYRHAAALNLVTVFHAGYDIGFADTEWASPKALAKALDWFDGAPVVAAHLGGSFCWQAVIQWLAGKPIYFDTAFSCGHIPLPEAKRLIEAHGIDRILFGSDLPWCDPLQELAFIDCLGLTASEKQQVLSGNACRLIPGKQPQIPEV